MNGSIGIGSPVTVETFLIIVPCAQYLSIEPDQIDEVSECAPTRRDLCQEVHILQSAVTHLRSAGLCMHRMRLDSRPHALLQDEKPSWCKL